MGCNCGGKNKTLTKYTHTKPDGSADMYLDEAQAKRAQELRGGTITTEA
jgi:hypothetical protein